MRNKIYGIFLMCLFGICMSVNAQGTPEIYNRDEKVILNHELFYYKEQYYFHIDDLEQLGFTVTLEDKKCTVTAEDCLGEDRKLVINKMMTLWSITAGDLYPLEGLLSLDEKSVSVNEVSCDGTYKKRSTKEIGDFADIILLPSDSFSFSGDKQILIKVGGEYYISSKYIGENMSHKYSLQDGRLDLFISDKNSVITDTTVNLKNGTVAKAGGWNVDIYTAYKTGDGDSLDDFEILSSTTCTVPENESSVKCFIETPAEKIESNNIYYIADFGNRYNFVCSEYDFSKVGTVLVYGEQKDIMYTMRVTLPEIDEADVPFTVYVVADKNTYSKEGIVKAGEISSIVEIFTTNIFYYN